ncbi:YbaN family protein [Aquabacterium sp. J223]|uniref:YbaN family protein n=1 Tax=Aquabacterium sp. J223 TaxID=2898431 RepID=UPI0021AD9B22|nr:YbaN family protein [Aquabacterium sp. J223]UUX97451.1 YbaN family protein [Aquabacterium sp. J223]
MLRSTVTLLWRALALLALLLALAGVVLPVLPTVPFVLVAAWAGGKGWPALERWLLDHAHLGPPLRRWRERGAVPRKAKWAATLAMTGSAVMLQFLPLPLWLQVAVPAVMVVVGAWIWCRPEA